MKNVRIPARAELPKIAAALKAKARAAAHDKARQMQARLRDQLAEFAPTLAGTDAAVERALAENKVEERPVDPHQAVMGRTPGPCTRCRCGEFRRNDVIATGRVCVCSHHIGQHPPTVGDLFDALGFMKDGMQSAEERCTAASASKRWFEEKMDDESREGAALLEKERKAEERKKAEKKERKRLRRLKRKGMDTGELKDERFRRLNERYALGIAQRDHDKLEAEEELQQALAKCNDDPLAPLMARMLQRAGRRVSLAAYHPKFLVPRHVTDVASGKLYESIESHFFERKRLRKLERQRARGHRDLEHELELHAQQQRGFEEAGLVDYEHVAEAMRDAYKDLPHFEQPKRLSMIPREEREEKLLRRREKLTTVSVQAPCSTAQFPPRVASHGNEVFYNYDGRWQDGLMHSRHGVYGFADGGTYVGEWSGGLRHGLGVAEYPNGDRYEGQWREGYFHGQGTMAYGSGVVYQGAWKHGRRHGEGRLTYPTGQSYEGGFAYGRRSGRGRALSAATLTDRERRKGVVPEQFEYLGNWTDGFIAGRGRLTEPDGAQLFYDTWSGCSLLIAAQHAAWKRAAKHKEREEMSARLYGPMRNLRLQVTVERVRAEREARLLREEQEAKQARKDALKRKLELMRIAKQQLVESVLTEQEQEAAKKKADKAAAKKAKGGLLGRLKRKRNGGGDGSDGAGSESEESGSEESGSEDSGSDESGSEPEDDD